jgi:hypothetical protein
MGTQVFGGFFIFFKGQYGVVCTMVYFTDFSRHQKAPFKGLARKSLILFSFYFISSYHNSGIHLVKAVVRSEVCEQEIERRHLHCER